MNHYLIALPFGGRGNEHAVSRRSAAHLYSAIREAGHTPLPLYIDRTGTWYLLPDGAVPDSVPMPPPGSRPVRFAPRGILLAEGLSPLTPDVVFPALHGQWGEDGTIQGFFAYLGIPCIGCGVECSVLAMNKALTKTVAAQAGVPTLPGLVLRRGTPIPDLSPYPVFIKPVRSGSSVGAGIARTPDEAETALTVAWGTDSAALAEPLFRGKEVEVAVLDDGVRIVSRPGEIEPNADFYDYRTKYRTGTARAYLPARISAEAERALTDAASRLFDALGCRHLARFDFFVGEDAWYFNEVNTLPGFTGDSLYPRLMEQAGIPLPALVTRLAENAVHGRNL